MKTELNQKVLYEPPQISFLDLEEPLSFMARFSRDAQFEDWMTEDGFSELEDEENWGTNDWGGFGGLGNDTTW